MSIEIKRKKNRIHKMYILIAIAFLSSVLTYGMNLSINSSKNINVYAIDWKIKVSDNGNITFAGKGFSYNNSKDAWNELLGKLQFFVLGISAIGTIAMVLFFVWNFIKLASTSDNERARSEVIKGLVWSAIATAALGSVTTFVALFLGVFK